LLRIYLRLDFRRFLECYNPHSAESRGIFSEEEFGLSSELARGLWKLRTAGSVEDLTKRYRRLCKLYHPDVHSPELRENFERQMQKINEEYASALKKFNIITYRNPAKGMSEETSRTRQKPKRLLVGIAKWIYQKEST